MTGGTLLTLVVLWASAAWTVAAAVPAIPAPFAIGVAVAALVQAELVRRLEMPRRRWTTGAEIAILAAVVAVSYVLLGANHDGGLLVGLAIAVVSWLLAQITVTDLEAVRQPVDLVEGMATPVERLRSRVLWVGLCLSVAVASLGAGLIPPSTPRDTSERFLVPYLAFWAMGLTGTAIVNRQRYLSRWSREGATIDGDLRARWVRGTVTWIAAAAFATALLLILGSPAFRALHEASSWVTAGIVTLTGGEVDPPSPPATRGATTPATAELPEPPEPLDEPARGPLGDFLLITALALIFASDYLLFGRQRRGDGPDRTAPIWRRLITMLIDLAKSIWGLLMDLVHAWRRRRYQTPASQLPPSSGARSRWNPTDPMRRHIATEFRTYLKAAENHALTPSASETVLEFGHRAAGEKSPATHQLASLYARARYSTHQLGEADNNAASAARVEAVADLEEGDSGVLSGGI
ncbi:MAG TPA: DUF4129 domain-containing protein [Acidimicrobiia bacterium]|nr:DUF4129 domain-containing protein [Acidimicrobiia bacterium]